MGFVQEWNAEAALLDDGPGQFVAWWNPVPGSGVSVNEHIHGLQIVFRDVQQRIWAETGIQPRLALACPEVAAYVDTIQLRNETPLRRAEIPAFPEVGNLYGCPIYVEPNTDTAPHFIGRGEIHFFFTKFYEWEHHLREIPVIESLSPYPLEEPPLIAVRRFHEVWRRPGRSLGVIKLRGYVESPLIRLARMA